MNDLVGVHVVAGSNDLDQKEACFGFCEAAASTEHVHEGAIVTEFEGHINVIVVFKAFVETNNVGMRQGTMDLDFCVKLVECEHERAAAGSETDLGFGLLGLEGGLGDNLARVAGSTDVSNFVHARKATLLNCVNSRFFKGLPDRPRPKTRCDGIPRFGSCR